ncbi:ATP-dependent DNA helicase PIF1-like protein [Tanacetum coccineum]
MPGMELGFGGRAVANFGTGGRRCDSRNASTTNLPVNTVERASVSNTITSSTLQKRKPDVSNINGVDTLLTPQSQLNMTPQVSMSLPFKRSRGRLRKNSVLSNLSGLNSVVTASQFSSQNKENKNPSKTKSSTLHLDNNTVKKALATKRPRGRPRKDSVQSNAVANESFLQSSPSSSHNNENLTPTTSISHLSRDSIVCNKLFVQSRPRTVLSNITSTNQSNVNNATITSTQSIDRIAMSGITQLPRSSDSITHQLIQNSSMNDGVASSTPNLYTPQTTLPVEHTQNKPPNKRGRPRK